MNSKFLNDSAETLAKHVAEVAPGDATAQIRHALHKATHRKPTDEEVQDGLDLIKELKEKPMPLRRMPCSVSACWS